ncbi:hypothetical protein BGW80DRAFT_1564856 [Lactifluus volemus]|nr:hypothetical protein BGW80DRAFT_1564856 [Lactifluus volemus]
MVILETTALLFHLDSSSQDQLLVFLKDLPKPESGLNPPHIYKRHDKEKILLQHDPDLSYPQGREGQYIRFSNHVWGLGWGNAMQEMVLNAHLAYLAKRMYASFHCHIRVALSRPDAYPYVFENYTWDKTSDDFSNYNGKPIPVRVPLTALLSGRVVGDPFPSSMDAPPAVVPEFYDVCPNPTIIDSTEINGGLSEPSAATTLQAWIDKLEKTEDRCVEIKEHQGRSSIYGPEMLIETSKRLLDIWPSLDTSPILTHFSWSLLATAALAANAPIIHPTLSNATPSDFAPSAAPTPLSGLLALHIRRGDYREHCKDTGLQRVPQITGPVPLSGGAQSGQCTSRRARTVPCALLSRDRSDRLTCARCACLALAHDDAQTGDARIQGMDEWEHIETSRDLRLARERRHNFQVVDMAIAQRSEVFLGNGFSSLTSNVVMLRAAQGMDWNKTRFDSPSRG